MTTLPSERRATRRQVRSEGQCVVFVRIRPGLEVLVIDASAGGALVETERRLLPGASVELYVRSGQRSEVVRGRIVRCAVARLCANAVCYRGAIAFDHHLRWVVDESAGYPVPGAEMRLGFASWAAATQAFP